MTVVDSFGDSCTWYDSNPSGCGSYDTSSFVAANACVACGSCEVGAEDAPVTAAEEAPVTAWCGGHSASSCAECPWMDDAQTNWAGSAWCNGDCLWVNGACTDPNYVPDCDLSYVDAMNKAVSIAK